jgi:hypothetical protein
MADDEKPGIDSSEEPDAVLAETPEDESEVEGQAISVEEFDADGRNADTVCGVYYNSN